MGKATVTRLELGLKLFFLFQFHNSQREKFISIRALTEKKKFVADPVRAASQAERIMFWN